MKKSTHSGNGEQKDGFIGEILDPSYRRVVESALHEEVRKIWGIPDFPPGLLNTILSQECRTGSTEHTALRTSQIS